MCLEIVNKIYGSKIFNNRFVKELLYIEMFGKIVFDFAFMANESFNNLIIVC